MKYDQIRKTIEEDYNNVAQSRVTVDGGRRNMKAFYVIFAKALEELHLAVSPFVTSKEQFVEHIEYMNGRVDKDVYDAMLEYCRTKLGIKL